MDINMNETKKVKSKEKPTYYGGDKINADDEETNKLYINDCRQKQAALYSSVLFKSQSVQFLLKTLDVTELFLSSGQSRLYLYLQQRSNYPTPSGSPQEFDLGVCKLNNVIVRGFPKTPCEELSIFRSHGFPLLIWPQYSKIDAIQCYLDSNYPDCGHWYSQLSKVHAWLESKWWPLARGLEQKQKNKPTNSENNNYNDNKSEQKHPSEVWIRNIPSDCVALKYINKRLSLYERFATLLQSYFSHRLQFSAAFHYNSIHSELNQLDKARSSCVSEDCGFINTVGNRLIRMIAHAQTNNKPYYLDAHKFVSSITDPIVKEQCLHSLLSKSELARIIQEKKCCASIIAADVNENSACMDVDFSDENSVDKIDETLNSDTSVTNNKQLPNRPISKEIMDNRGLVKYRHKRERNPRVHLRHKFRKATIRYRSRVAPIRKEDKPYSGELKGIRVNLVKSHKFKTNGCLTNLQVCNNQLVAATGRNTLVRCSTVSPIQVSEIEISRLSDDRVHNLFLDPMGWHTIISMQSGMNFYTNRSMKKVKPLNKTKDNLFDSVAWNRHNTDELSTQEILVGTNDGLIFETMLMFNEDSLFTSGSIEQYWKQLINLGHSVTGLEIIRFPPGSPSVLVGEPQRCVVLATTPGRMYQFAGWINTSAPNMLLSHIASNTSMYGAGTNASNPSPNWVNPLDEYVQLGAANQNQLFSNLNMGLYYGLFGGDEKMPAGSKVTEFPGNFGYSDLKLYQDTDAELPSCFAWMTGPGVYFGHLKTEQLSLPPFTKPSENDNTLAAGMETAEEILSDGLKPIEPGDVFAGRGVNLTRQTKLIPYPIIKILERPGTPLGISLTSFHVIVLYTDRIKAVNTLDGRTIYSMPLNNVLSSERALGIWRDCVSGQIWMFSSTCLARLTMKNELVRIWQIYLDRLKFDEARRYCQDESKRDLINIREAEYFFDKRNFMQAAKLFARTSLPFEQVALRFSYLTTDGRNSSSSAEVGTGAPLSLRTMTDNLSALQVVQGLEVVEDHDILNALIQTDPMNKEQKSRLNELNYLTLNHSTSGAFMNNSPLKYFISAKLDCLINQKNSNKQSMNSQLTGQITLLSMWLIEILLTELGIIRDRLLHKEVGINQSSFNAIQREFRILLTRPEVLAIIQDAKPLIYDILESHGENEELIYFAELVGDFPRLVDHYMRVNMYHEALRVLSVHSVCINQLYDYASCLAENCPGEFVNVCLHWGSKLEPHRLLSALIILPHDHAIRYLESVIGLTDYNHNLLQNTTNQALHHLLISLYAIEFKKNQPDSNLSSKDQLITYLEHVSAHVMSLAKVHQNYDHTFEDDDNLGNSDLTKTNFSILSTNMTSLFSKNFSNQQTTDINQSDFYFPLSVDNKTESTELSQNEIQLSLPYDPGYVLRTCKEVGHLRGMVFILLLLGMYQQALQLAIEWNNIPLAKEVAQTDYLNQDLRRQLWIQLAQHVIGKQSDMKEATNLLRECPLLRLEDILPYFHDFVTIDQFKDVICSSLDSYSERIDDVKREIQITMKTTNELRNHLNNLHYRYEVLDSDTRCAHCNYLLTIRGFYVFSCGHNFHASCLIEMTKPYLTSEQKNKLNEVALMGNNKASTTNFEDVFDQIIAADCILCGRIAIQNVSKLFYSDQATYESDLAVWQ